MHIVNQLTPFTCGLACIESLTHDLNVPVTQAELLVTFKSELIGDVADSGDFGATSTDLLQRIWTSLGFSGAWQTDHRKNEVRDIVFRPHSPRHGLLIASNFRKNGQHCIRFAGLKDDDTILAMVPSFGLIGSTIEEISIADLIDWKYSFAVLKL